MKKKIILLIIIFALIVFGAIFFFGPKKEICGNETCEKEENCISCPEDCKCEEGMYCSEKTKSCQKPVCGNEICEYFETPETCCLDCKCFGKNEICDPKENKCKKVETKIDDEKVLELVRSYYKAQGKKITSLEIGEVAVYQGKIGKEVLVNIEDQDWFDLVFVTEEGIVTQIKEP